jgi:hypothetical protein
MSEEPVKDGVAVLRSVASDLFQSLDTPISLSCEILLRYGDLEQLVRKTVSPFDYNCPQRFADDYQAISFLRKAPLDIPGVDRRAAAKKKFLEAEERCRETNHRIRLFIENPERASSVVRHAYCLTINAINEVLGSYVSPSEWLNSCRFGPGVFNSPGARGLTSIYDKLQVTPSVTPDFGLAGSMLVMSSPSWARSITELEYEGFWPFVREQDLVIVPGNRVSFVPKTATTDRAIAIEPLINIYAQLGLGAMIRRRLKAFAHIDLNDQSLNQELAREGSIRGYLCTIDLSSASDTVASGVVRALLPECWYSYLNLCRSKFGEVDGRAFVYEKFSSMGNGFTFELESLLFWAFSKAACEISGCADMISVYGDDIVVPVDAYETLEEILTFFGFELNRSKSFSNGPFRESCGKDYYNGADVRPFLQKEVPQGLEDLFTLANGLRRLAHRRLHPYPGCDVRYRRAYESAVRAIPKPVRLAVRVPAHAGDSDGLVTDWDEAQVSPFVRSHPYGWEGSLGLRFAYVSSEASKCYHFEGGVASLLYKARANFEGSDLTVPVGTEMGPSASPRQGRSGSFKLRSGAFYGPWTNLGPWC